MRFNLLLAFEMVKFKIDWKCPQTTATGSFINIEETKSQCCRELLICDQLCTRRRKHETHCTEKHKPWTSVQHVSVMLRGQVQGVGQVGRTVSRATAAPLGEVGGEEAERLALVGGQRRAVALEVARDAAAGGTRAVAEGLDAALPLQLWRERDTDGQRERQRERESSSGDLFSNHNQLNPSNSCSAPVVS